jgi:xylulokinase
MSLLGIDVGTTGCKAAAFLPDGRCLAGAYREYPTLHVQEGWAELDSGAVWTKVCEAIREVAAGTRGDPVTALSVSSMGEAMVPVSSDRRILANSILMSDRRGGEYVAALTGALGDRAFYEINPNIPGAHYSLPKLRWIKDHQPDLYGRTHRFLPWGDLVLYLLGGDPVTSYSLANRTLLFDIRAQDWSAPLLSLGRIERDKLPRPVRSGTVSGTIRDAVADDLGLPRGVQLVVGGHDQSCNALGAGIVQAGRAVCGIGTFECITPVYDRIPESSAMLANGLNVEHHVVPDLYVSFLYNQSGSLVRWFRDTFAAADKTLAAPGVDLYDRLAAEMPGAPTPLMVLPYFEVTGPPAYVSDLSGAILGLKTNTTRGEILKAIMESATFYFVDGLRGLAGLGIDMTSFTATGGGAKSDAWLQIKADIYGVPMLRPRITEAGTLGAAMLAGVATGVYRSPQEAVSQGVQIERTFMPDAARHAQYRERQAVFDRLYPTLRPLLTALRK